MNNYITLFLFGIGMYLIIRGLNSCPPPEKVIEIRYVPRTFKEEQENPIRIIDLFSQMFNETTVQPNVVS